jgi:Glycosyltransferase
MNMRVLHLRSSVGLYGAEQVILNLAGQLNAVGCANHIVCICNVQEPHLELVKEAERRCLSAFVIDCRRLIDFHTIKSLRELIRNRDIDVIHCHDYKASVFGLLAATGLKVKRVATNHLWTRSSLRLRIYQTIEGILYNCFDKVVAVSDVIENECRPFVFRKSKLTVIPNGIDLHPFALENRIEARRSTRARLGLKESDLVIGNIARLSVEKDQAVLLRAFRILTSLYKERSLKLLMAGDGPEKSNLKGLAKQLDIDNDCLFTGFRSDVPEILNCLDVYVQSSRREGLPMIILEAMASQVAIVSTKAGGVPTVIADGEHGRLVEIGDPDQLARVLDDVLSNPDERRALGQQARVLVEAQFSAHAMAARYLTVYAGITENRECSHG